MIKKLLRPFLIILLVGFSFFYTDKSIDLIRESDPLMKQIKNTNYKYQQEPVDAKIEGNTIIPGLTGKEIDELNTKLKDLRNQLEEKYENKANNELINSKLEEELIMTKHIRG